MVEIENNNVTMMLQRWQKGDQQALDTLIPIVYNELRHLASSQLRRDKKASIQCTELVAEAYLKLIDTTSVDWQSRTHFFSLAAKTMRRVLVERYRARKADKRGNNKTLLTYKEEFNSSSSQSLELDSLDDSLTQLEKLDSRQAEIVTLKFFGGLKIEEIAQILTILNKLTTRLLTILLPIRTIEILS